MTTVTNMTAMIGSYPADFVHGHFSFLGSTPSTTTIGSVQDGWVEAHHVRGGAIIDSYYGPRSEVWVTGQDGDQVIGRFVAPDGSEAGDFETYEFSVPTAEAAADYELWVNDTSGSDSNAGTEAEPFKTIARVQTEINSLAPSAGEIVLVHLNKGDTFTVGTGTALGSGSATTPYCIILKGSGSGADPIILGTSLSGTLFDPGYALSLHAHGITFTGANSWPGSGTWTNNTRMIANFRSGTTTRYAYNILFTDCSFSRWTHVIYTQENQYTAAERANGTHSWDFVGFDTCVFDEGESYFIHGDGPIQYLDLKDCTFGPTNFNCPWRLYGYARMSWIRMSHDDEDYSGGPGNTVEGRWLGPAGTNDDDRSHDCDFYMCVFKVSRANGGLQNIECDSDGTPGFFYGIRYFGWEGKNAGFRTAVDVGGTGGVDVDEIQFFMSYLTNSNFHPTLQLTTSNESDALAKIRKFKLWQSVLFSSPAGSAAFNCSANGGYRNNWVDGCLDVRGNYFLDINSGAGASKPFQFTSSNSDWDTAGVAALFTECDYNHRGKVGTAVTQYWLLCYDGNVTLSAWQSASSLDANSTWTNSTDFNFTDAGASSRSDVDARVDTDPGSSYPGYPGIICVDIDHKFTASGHDAGINHYGETTNPTTPDIGGTPDPSSPSPDPTSPSPDPSSPSPDPSSPSPDPASPSPDPSSPSPDPSSPSPDPSSPSPDPGSPSVGGALACTFVGFDM